MEVKLDLVERKLLEVEEVAGHAPEFSPYWLKGFYFEDKTVLAHNTSNAELAAILDPTGDQYATYIPFIYDTSRFDFCDGFEQWWANEQDDDVYDVIVPAPIVLKDPATANPQAVSPMS